jgi:hypothetical protein
MKFARFGNAVPAEDPDKTVPDTAGTDPGAGTASARPVPRRRKRRSFRERAGTSTAARRAALTRKTEGLRQYRPPSIAQQTEYAKSRSWIREGHDPDRWAGKLGEFQARTAGMLLVILGNAIAGLGKRNIRQHLAIAAILFLLFIIARGLLA